MFDSISDASNPFNKTGLSREDRALLQYVADAAVATGRDLVATCTTDHPMYSAAGNVSRHRRPGTDGEGLAIDGRMRTRGTSKGLHLPWFEAFVPVEHLLHELIYAFPPSGKRADGSFGPYNIRAGKRVAPYAVESHEDHGHVAVALGVFVKWPLPVAPPPTKAGVMVRNYVASLVAPNGGTWHLAGDGGIVTDTDGVDGPEAPFYGSVPGVGGLGAAKARGLLPHGDGYKVVVQHADESVSYFHFPAS